MKHINVKKITDAYNGYNNEEKQFDPTGSYTGQTDKGEPPTQDADDL